MGFFVNYLNSVGHAGSMLLGLQFGYCLHLLARKYYYDRKDWDESKIGPNNLPAAGPLRRQ